MIVGDVVNVFEAHAASMFMVEDGDSMFPQNVGNITQIHKIQQPKNR
jgi:hypothetical protein